MKKIGILHISDIHISEPSIPHIDIIVEKLIKDINKVKLENDVNIDLICFAGDLIARGDNAFEDEKQIELAERHFIVPLLKATGLTNKEFILVPGNHEVDIRKIAKRTEDGLAALSSLKDINDTIYEMEDEYKKRLKYYYDYMYEKYVDDAEPWNLGYSIIRNINGIDVGIIGVDSAWRSTGVGFSERGHMLVGEHQVGVLYNNIKNADLKICLMHHPIDWLSEKEMTNVERKLNYFDLVLRGHVHDLEDKQICTQKYKTIYNTSGKLYPIDNFYSGYSILNINMDVNTCSIYSREYLKSPREDFDKALRINENGKVIYQLTAYDEAKVVEFDLKIQLREYFEEATEKYSMLRSIDSYSPQRVGDFFVEPIIYEKSEYERTEANRKKNENEMPIHLSDLMEKNDNILIIGKKECGKTTILQRFGIWYTHSDSEKLPVFIDMMKLGKGKNRILVACQNFVFNNMSPDVPISREQVFNILSNGKALCLFDNVNISDVNHIKWIQNFTKEFSQNRFIFAAEEKFYQTYSLKELPSFGVKYKPVYLDFFGKRQVREMVTKWGKGKDGFNANELTNKIVSYCNNINFAMTPFNIAVFMTIWDLDRNFVPINEGKVMRAYLETVLDKFSAEGFQRSEYDYDVKQHFLGYLAYIMCQKDEYYFTLDEFDNLVDEYHSKKGFKKSQSKFDVIFFEKNILCKNGDFVFFGNTSIMEYCIASYAVVDQKLYELMIQKGNRASFAHELSFYSGIVHDCSNLLNILNDEITEIILENMDILDEIERLSIRFKFELDTSTVKQTFIENRCSVEEIDDMDRNVKEKTSPTDIKKINTIEKRESFMDLLLIYGNVIKNAETVDKDQKKMHLENYMLGINFQFGLALNELSAYLTSKTKVDLPEEIKEKHPNLTDEEFNEMKQNVLDLLKIILPIALQFNMVNNVGTPKLEIVIDELINSNKDKKFTRFMLSFLLCDIGNGKIKHFLSNYIKEENSQDILKLILAKLGFYYSFLYFGNNSKMDEELLDLITEVHIKLSDQNNLKTQAFKGEYRKQIKKQYDAQRNKMIS